MNDAPCAFSGALVFFEDDFHFQTGINIFSVLSFHNLSVCRFLPENPGHQFIQFRMLLAEKIGPLEKVFRCHGKEFSFICGAIHIDV